MKKLYHENMKCKKTEVTLFIKTRVDFKTGSVGCDRKALCSDRSIISWRKYNKSKCIYT